MDTSAGDSSLEGLYEDNAPPSPSPASRSLAPGTPKEGNVMSPSLAFRPPPRPGSSLRKGRMSDFNTPAPPPLPQPILAEHLPLSDTTNIEGPAAAGGSSTPSRPSSASSVGHPSLYNFAPSSEGAKALATTRTCRQKLQSLREENQSQVNSAGLLGQGLLELRSRIEALMDELAEELSLAEENANHSDADKHESSARIQHLSEKIDAEIEEMENQKQKLYKDVLSHTPDVGDQTMISSTESPTKAARVASAIKNLTGTTPSKAATGGSAIVPTPRQGDRRSRNAAARQARADSELINEIQAGLVQEVRRLQGLLKERDDQRGVLERSNADLEKQLDQYKPRVILMTETEDALKQENWDLSISKQNLEEQLAERTNTLKKSELENMRLTKDLGKTQDTVDAQRLQIDAHLAEIDKIAKQRETEVAMARKERIGMQRDVSDLQTELQRFKAQQMNERGNVSRSVSNSYMSEMGQEDDNDPDALAARLRAAYTNEAGLRSLGDSMYSEDMGPMSPLGNRIGRDRESQELRAKLAMAQKKAGKDAADKRRVREKNAELKKLLSKAGVKVPQGLDDDVESSEDEGVQWFDESAPNSPSLKRLSKVRASKGALRPSMAKRLGLTSSNSTESVVEYEEETEVADKSVDEAETTVEGDVSNSSPRTSLDGIDPAFADVMRPNFGTPSNRKGALQSKRLSTGGSPLARQTVLAESEECSPPRATSRLTGRRSNAAARPTSEVFEPSALGNELEGLGEQPLPTLYTEGLLVPERSLEETGVVTEPFPDLVTPALEDKERQHQAAILTLQQTHASLLSQRTDEHTKALLAAQDEHKSVLDRLREEHDQQLVSKDRSHASKIASTLADRTKIHEAALAESRSRHSRALAEQVSTSSAALAEAIAKHKALTEEQEMRHKDENERREASHTYALSQKDRQHREATVALEAAHLAVLAQRDDAHKALAASEEALKKAQDEIEKLKAFLKELQSTDQSASDLQSERDAEIQKLKETSKDLEAKLASTETSAATAQSERDAEIKRLALVSQELETKLKNSEQTASNVQAEIQSLKSAREDLENKLRLTEQRASNVQSERDAASGEEIKRAHLEIDTLKAAGLALEAKFKAAEQSTVTEREQNESQANQLRASIQELESKLKSADQNTAKLQSEKDSEITSLKANLSDLEAQLKSTEQKTTDAHAQRGETEKELASTKTALALLAAKIEQYELAEAQRKAKEKEEAAAKRAREAEETYATEAETDAENFEDAVSHMKTSSMSQPAVRSKETSESGSDEGAVPQTPADTDDESGVRKVVLADLKDNSCQTDDLLWNNFQDSLAPRPMSALTTSTRTDGVASSQNGDAVIGQGGVMVLGGHRSNRPRDSVSTFGGNRDGSLRPESPAPTMYTVGAVTGETGRRASTDSTWSRRTGRANEVPPVPPLPDKTKPPVMSMPPPPAMPPPATAPIKRAAPPRPTSPPPSDLLSRAQKPALLQVPFGEQPRSVSRASTRSAAPPNAFTSTRTRQQSAGGSVRTRTYSTETSNSVVQPSQLDRSIYNEVSSGRKSVASRRSAAASIKRGPRQSSAASFVSDVTSEISRRFSLASSQASGDADDTFVVRNGQLGRPRGMSEFGAGEGTDPMVIHAITQTMIGEYMHKYTRKSMGRGGHSYKRHRRYFWVHPYTKMLYWTISDPGGAKVSEGTSKSASIEGVRVVEDSNPSPPGLFHKSLVITTATREVKITAPSRERHEAWLGALEYLVNRPAVHDVNTITAEVGAGAVTDFTDGENNENFNPRSIGPRSKSRASGRPSLLPQKSFLSRKSTDNMPQNGSTPRKRGSSIGASSVMYPSIGKRRDLPAREWLQQHEREAPMSPTSSIKRGLSSPGQHIDPDDSYDHLLDLNDPITDPRLQTAEEMLEEDEPEGFDGLANVRACCDGKHDVGSLAHDHDHHRDHSHGSQRRSRLHGRQSSGRSHFSSVGLKSKLDAAVRAAEDRERPISPNPSQLPLNLGRDSTDSTASRANRPSDSTFSSALFSTASEHTHAKHDSRSASQPSTVGPSYGERIQKIRKARQSTSSFR